jgi:hypothetical protein
MIESGTTTKSEPDGRSFPRRRPPWNREFLLVSPFLGCSRPPARPFGSRIRGSCLVPLGSWLPDSNCDYYVGGGKRAQMFSLSMVSVAP